MPAVQVVLPFMAMLAAGQSIVGPERYGDLIALARDGDVRTAVAAVLDWSQGQIDVAVRSYVAADALCLESCRAAALVHTEAAFVLFQLGGPGEAEKHLRAATKLVLRESGKGIAVPVGRDDFEVHWRLAGGHLYRQFARPRDAVIWYDHALKRHHTHPEALVAMGALYEYVAASPVMRSHSNTGLPAAARRYEQALAEDPAYDEARLRLGRLLVLLNRREPAARELQRVAAAHTSGWLGAYARLFQGDLAEREGRLDDAITHYRRAVEMQPGLQPAQLALSHALQVTGRGVDATAVLRESLDISFGDTVHGWNAYHTTVLHGFRHTLDRLWKQVHK
jgi:tetratricopeptide (TPR) repeat protein